MRRAALPRLQLNALLERVAACGSSAGKPLLATGCPLSSSLAEFAANGLGGLVTVAQRDIEEGGFPADLHGAADAVFLDLPKPYKVRCPALACLPVRWLHFLQ